MSIRTIAPAVLALVALLLVVIAPTGAAAHGGMAHAHAAKHVSDGAAASDAAVPKSVELRAQPPVSADHQADSACGDRGCCGAGHCSGCGTAIEPASWICLHLPSDVLLLNPDASLPASLAREGPPRPPKSFA